MPDRWFTVEELYNTNRDPVDLGIVHPLVYENEDSLVGQIGYCTGALHNTDRHGMVWCRNFEGGRSFTSTLGHNWQYATEAWFRDMMLNAIQWTERAGVRELRHVQRGHRAARGRGRGGNVTAAANTALSAALAAADAAYRAGDKAGAATHAKAFVAQAKRVATPAPTAATALLELQTKGVELVNWMSGNEAAPPTPTLQSEPAQGTRRRHGAGDALADARRARRRSRRSRRAWRASTRPRPRPRCSPPRVTRRSASPTPAT